MAMYRKRPLVVDAEQFHHPATAPRGVRTEEDGRAYVVTIHGQRAYLETGDWVIQEPDGEHYYPCKPQVFENAYDKEDWRMGLNCKPKLRTHPLFSCAHNCVIIGTRASSLHKDGLLLIAVDDGRELLEPADDWMTA